MIFIQDLKEGDTFCQVFFCKQKMSATAKTGKTYYSLKLQDKTGAMDAKVWDLTNAIENFDAGNYILCDGHVQSYNNVTQAIISRIRVADEGEYDQRDYLPTSDFPTEEMLAELVKLKNKVTNPYLSKLLNAFFEDPKFVEAFKTHSAAKAVHHSFISGLLQHTLRVTQLCYFLSLQYPMINKDLIITAAIFHDIGKLKEIADFPANDYTDEGQLIGHIVIGYEMVKDKIDLQPDFPKTLRTELLHCILAHQGKLEYGSPKTPSLIEAMALSYADDTDAKMEIMVEEFNASSSDEFLGVNRYLGTNIRKTIGPKED